MKGFILAAEGFYKPEDDEFALLNYDSN